MGTTKQSQGQFILSYLESKTNKKSFTIDDIYKAIHSDKEFMTELNKISPDCDYQAWSRGYLSSLFHNYTVRPKNPKIQRTRNKVYHYSLVKK